MIKDDLFDKAAKSLQVTTGIRATVSTTKTVRSKKSDGHLKIFVGHSAVEHILGLQIKRNLNNAALGNLAVELKIKPERTVIVTDYVTPEQVDKLRVLDIPFFDSAGNAYFNEPGLYVLISGRKAKTEKEKPLRLFRPVSLKVLFLLLAYPDYVNKDYRTLASKAGVSLGAVSETFNDLRRNRYLLLPGNNERKLTRKSELLKKWVEAYINKLRIDLQVARFRTDKYSGKRWWEDVNIKDFGAFWGGEVAAEKLTGYLKPETATIYADTPIPNFQVKFGLRRDPNGNIEIINRFWQSPEESETVHPLIVYADLIATGDERNLETAKIIYEQELARLTGETAL